MQVNCKKITIIGAGIAGLTSALSISLAAKTNNQTVEICLFEATMTASEEGAGLQLSPNATHILQKLGLLDELLAFAIAPDNILMSDGLSNRSIADIPLGDFAKDRYGAPYLVIHRAHLHQVLLNHANQQANINIEYNHKLVQIEKDVLYFQHGEKLVQNIADIYIAADGVWSKTKSLLNLEFANLTTFSGHIAWRCLIEPSKLDQQYLTTTRVWLAEKSHIVLYPVSSGQKLNMVVFTEGEFKQKTWAQPANLTQLKQIMQGWNSEVQTLLDATDHINVWPLCAGFAQYQNAKDSFLLVGDAAHPTLPYQAQGAAMAIEDAACLANTLYNQQHNWHHWSADKIAQQLREFEQNRHQRVTKTQNTAVKNAKIFHMPPTTSWARDLYLGILSKFNKRALLTRLDWLYAKRYDNF